MLSLLSLLSSMISTLLLFFSGNFLIFLLFVDIDLIGNIRFSKSKGEVDVENDSTELGVGTRRVTNLLDN